MSEGARAPDRRSGRPDRRKARIPRHAFWKGAATGILVGIPAVAFGVWLSARVGITDHDAGLIECLRMAVLFAGVATVLTAGGVGRLAAEASSEGGRPRAVMVAARAMAPAGAALVIIAAIPHGELPMTPGGWVALAVVGAIVGAGSGAVIGSACAGELPTLQELGVWPPTEWPVPWPFDDDAKKDERPDEKPP
ncbi:MAG: hypothetical protein K8M05_30020 [Deltaproteobacteria bacterium]|nr:hypothetical protein [Kofleriaceae bacterium]